MEQENQQLNQEIGRLQDHIRRLDNDPGEQELEIRQRLKLLKPGEKVYITGEPAKK
jgi:cell division protein FtsB